MTEPRRQIAVLAAMLMAGCVTAQGSQGPADEPWVEVRTEHFRVRAQVDEPAAVEIAQGLEATRAAVLSWWGPGVTSADRLEVLVYRDSAALADFVPAQTGGFIAQGSNGPTIVTSLAGLRQPAFRRVQAHQLAHHLGAYLTPRQPRWLSEGLAQYLEAFDTDGQKATFGKPPGSVGPADLSGQPITLAQLWDWTTQDDLQAQKSAWAWWLVAWLAGAHADQFDLWQRALRRGDDPKPAWDRAFSDLPDAALEAEAVAALGRRELKFSTRELSFKPGTAEASVVPPADLHAARAELLLQSSPLDFEYRRATATAELDAALALEPQHADALVLKARLISDPAAARAFSQRMIELLPQNAKAWGLMASLVGRDGEDPRESLQFALALEPNHPGLLNTLAWYCTLFDDKTQGLKLAERAAALRPWSPAMVDTHAAVLGASGRCPEAAARERQALDMLVHGGAAQRANYVARLRAYETQCTRARPTALER